MAGCRPTNYKTYATLMSMWHLLEAKTPPKHARWD